MQLELFRCVRRELTLTPKGCARLFESAADNPPLPHEGRAACIGCPVGAVHAGRPVPPSLAWKNAIAPVCAGCAKVSDRIIQHRYCPSCYNRRLEAKKGANAKGTPPRITPLLFSAAFAAPSTAPDATVARVPGVLSLTEAALIVAKSANAPLTLGWPGLADAA